MTEYNVNGVIFKQKEIVAKQYTEIMNLLEIDKMFSGVSNKDVKSSVNEVEKNFLRIITTNIIDFLDIILTCDDISVNKKEFISNNFDIKTMNKVVSDFFASTDLFLIIGQGAPSIMAENQAKENQIKEK